MGQEEPIKTALHDVQKAMGASFAAEGGWYWLDGFGDVPGEYRAVREGVGVWDMSPLIKWEWRGSDAAAAIQRVFSNDTPGMEVGQVRYGGFLDAEGNLVDDGTVFRLADDHFWVMTNGMDLAKFFAGATGGLDVGIEHVTHDMPNFQVQGPGSRDLLSKLTDADLSGLGYFRFRPELTQVGGVPAWISRTGFSGELGYELFVRRDDAEALWNALVASGAKLYGNSAIETCRIESGMVVTGFDYQPGAGTPFDVGLDRFVALGADIPGQSRLAEVAAAPPNRFKTLRWDGDELPEYGTPVMKGGEEVGLLTSPTNSPIFGPIGLAVIRADVAEEGGNVEVQGPNDTISATVTSAPIYDPKKERVRM
ncbi:MAG: aminomethyltransferase family protein [Actinomycetota bacterium]